MVPTGIWAILSPRAVKVSLSKAQLFMSNDFNVGKNRSLLSRFSEELPIFLLTDKSSSWRFESKGITWAVKIPTVTRFRHHLTDSHLVLDCHNPLNWTVTNSPQRDPALYTPSKQPSSQGVAQVFLLPSFSPDQKLRTKTLETRKNWVLILNPLLQSCVIWKKLPTLNLRFLNHKIPTSQDHYKDRTWSM